MSAKMRIARGLAEAGLEKHAIAGVLANLSGESGFSPTAVNPTSGAYGIGQWLGGRKTALQGFASKRGTDVSDLDTQIAFLISEIKSGKQMAPGGSPVTVASLNAQKNARRAGRFFAHNFERGGYEDVRAAAAPGFKDEGRRAVGVSGGKGGGKGNGKTYTWVPAETGHNYNVFHQVGAKAYNNPKQWHTGNDIGAPDGSDIQWAPPVDGKVIKVAQGGDYGPNWMIIRDTKGREWLFAHMSSTPMKVGKKVTQGMKIGEVGLGHLHLEQTIPGKSDWEYDSPDLKAPKLTFKSKADYQGGSQTGDTSPADYISGIGVAKSWLDNPGMEEIRDLVARAAEKDWSQDRFMWKLRDTDWYIQRSESQRKFDMMQSRDQEAVVRQAKASVKTMAEQFGVTLTDKQIEREAFRIARDGDSTEMQRGWLARKYVYDPVQGQSGTSATFQEALQERAADFGVTLTAKDLQGWTRDAIARDASPDEYLDDMRTRAQELYPWLDLSNKTTRQALASYLQVASSELDIDPNTVDLTDPMWTEVGKADESGPMSTEEWRRKIISDKRYGWGNSRRGKQASVTLAASLGRIFGGLSY